VDGAVEITCADEAADAVADRLALLDATRRDGVVAIPLGSS
jgi:hypothetical protein